MAKQTRDVKNADENQKNEKKNKEETGQKTTNGESTEKEEKIDSGGESVTEPEKSSSQDQELSKVPSSQESLEKTDTVNKDIADDTGDKELSPDKHCEYYVAILGAKVRDVYFDLSPSGIALLELMGKYASMANPNVMMTDENKVLAPCTLYRLLVGLENIEQVDSNQKLLLLKIIKDNNDCGAFSNDNINRECFNYEVLGTFDRLKLGDLIDKFINN